MKKAVLFDFHNTIATCDRWLDLEIRTLPGLVIQELVQSGILPENVTLRTPEADERFKALRHGVRSSGVELSAVDGTRTVFREMNVSASDADIGRTVALLEGACLEEVEIVEGARVALEHLRDEGLVLGVVSSAGYPPFVEMALEKLDLQGFFSVVITSAGEGIYKSDPEIFRRALRRLGVLPEEAVHVGDHPIYDVQTAKSAGLSTIWFTSHTERTALMHRMPLEEVAKAGSRADAVINSLDQLSGVIKKLLGS